MAAPHPALLSVIRGEHTARVEDPDALLRSAREHRVDGLLYAALQEGRISVPRQHKVFLATRVLRQQAATERALDVLGEITDLLQRHELYFLVFKGLATESQYYGAPGRRPAADIDIMLAPESLKRIDEVLGLLAPDHPAQSAARALVATRLIPTFTFRYRDTIEIDLHIDPFKLGVEWRDHEEIWNRSRRTLIHNKVPAHVFDHRMALLHAVYNLARDRFRYLIGFADVAYILDASQLTWEEIEPLAERQGIDASVRVAFEIASSVLNRAHPPSERHSWRATLWRSLWRPELRLLGDESLYRYGRRAQWLIPLTAKGRFIEAASWWIRTAIPPAVVLDYRHPNRTGSYLTRLLGGRRDEWMRQRAMRAQQPK